LDIENALVGLASDRPVFHSEADLQHALAWRVRELHPGTELRLERPIRGASGRIYLDIWCRSGEEVVGVELKYKTRSLATDLEGEEFRLRHQAAQDIARYDFLTDIVRLESLRRLGRIKRGVAVFLTNDPGYWKDSGKRGRVDEAFRIHEGRRLQGALAWASHASKGTTKGRTEAVRLANEYTISWRDYAKVGSAQFRYVFLQVGR
jgi:hypothetical protein